MSDTQSPVRHILKIHGCPALRTTARLTGYKVVMQSICHYVLMAKPRGELLFPSSADSMWIQHSSANLFACYTQPSKTSPVSSIDYFHFSISQKKKKRTPDAKKKSLQKRSSTHNTQSVDLTLPLPYTPSTLSFDTNPTPPLSACSSSS